MAAPVRVESRAFADPRYEVLGALAGYNRYEALGRMTHLWSVCTERGVYVVSEAFIVGCLGPRGVDAILGAELGERTQDGIRVRGTAGRTEWKSELSSKRQHAGQTRAQTASRDARGRMVSSKTRSADQQNTSTDQHTSTEAPNQAQSDSKSPAPVQHMLDKEGLDTSGNSSVQQITSTRPAPVQHPSSTIQQATSTPPAKSSALTLTLKEEEKSFGASAPARFATGTVEAETQVSLELRAKVDRATGDVGKRKARNGDSDHHAVIAEWTERFEAKHGAKPTWDGKGVSAVQRLLSQHSRVEIVRRMAISFDSPRDFPPQPWSFAVFASRFDELATQPRKPTTSTPPPRKIQEL